jgi:hypothetical protein
MSHVLIYSGLCGAILVIYKMAMRQEVHQLEKIGTLIAIIGCIISIFDPKAGKVSDNPNEIDNGSDVIMGDCIAFAASLFSILFFIYNKEA